MRHKVAEKLHAIKRFKERLGLNLTNDQYHKICEKCLDRKYARFVQWKDDRKYGRVQILEIEDFGFRFRVVYNPMHFCIVTVLFSPIICLNDCRNTTGVKKEHEIEFLSPIKYANPNNWVPV